MAAWLQAALKMLAVGQGINMASDIAVAGAGMFGGGEPYSDVMPGRGAPRTVWNPITQAFEGVRRRRRRRRALTASDRADIAFIAGILGKAAGKDIAAIIAART